jgi:hypothetical protein
MFALGLSPRTNPEKTKISEHYRKMQEVIAAESHQKMTRLTQRRHSTCQKMNRLDRKNSGKNTSGHTSGFGSNRTLGLKKQLDQIDTEIHETVIQSKENLGRIAAEKEKQLRSISAAEIGSIEFDSDEDYPDLMALSLDAPRPTQRISGVSEKKRQNGLKLSGLLDRIPRPEFRTKKSKRSLSRSKSAALGMDKKKSASSLLSLSSFDRPVSLTGLNEHMTHSHATKDSSEDGDVPVLSTYPIDDGATGIYSSTFNTDTASMTLAEKVKNREENLSVLRDSVLEEFEKFSEFCSEFGEKCSGTSRGSIVTDCSELEHGARITQGENLI